MDQLDAAAWDRLKLLEQNVVRLDVRSALDRVKLPGFISLYEAGYCTLVETGPGDSVNLFTITAAGKAALAAGRSDNA